jgi:membrane peptidoglycan carboxypeptidase
VSGTHRAPASGDDTDGTEEGGKQKRGWPFRIFRWSMIAGLALALLAVAGFVFVYTKTTVPDPNADFETQTTHIYYAGGKQELGSFYTHNRESIPFAEMPDSIKDAVVAAENRGFWTDKGIDPRGILRAAFSNAQGNNQQGASTITQQYVKILYLTQERSYKRKIKEAFLSLKIHRQQTKERILEGYLNTIYFGRGAYGVEAAAKAYFNTKAEKLSVKESAVLASVINNPTLFDPDNREGKKPNPYLVERYQYVLSGMASADNITAEEAEKASARLPKIHKEVRDDRLRGQRGHMLTMVEKELERLIDSGELEASKQDIQGGGLRVTTTFTHKAMKAAEEAVKEERPEGKEFDRQLHIGVASVQPGTGAVRGFYGGQDFLKSEINWAVAGGMGGSTLKAFAVAAALEDGYSLKDSFDGNSPFVIPGTDLEFSNQDFRDYGRVSMLKATENSINSAFIDMTMAMDNGAEKILKTANDMGIPPAESPRRHIGFPNQTYGLEPVVGLSLGSGTVSPINMANSYATIANRGKWAEPYVIERVVDRNGEELYKHRVNDKRALEEDIADDVSYALQQTVEKGTGTAALELGRPAAGKTGTATADAKKEGEEDPVSSAWFVGYTPQLSTAVMYVRGKGNEQLKDWMPAEGGGFAGGAYPARTWTNVMTRALDGADIEEFPPPAYVDGEAPSDGHDPYTPPPPPPTKTKPTKQPPSTNTPSHTPPGQTNTPPGHSDDPTPTLPTAPPSSSEPSDPESSDTECPFPPCGRDPRRDGGEPLDQRQEQVAREQYARLD